MPIASIPASYRKLSSSVCSSDSFNFVPLLPRFSLTGLAVSSDLGAYPWFDCGNASSESFNASAAGGFNASAGGVNGSLATLSLAPAAAPPASEFRILNCSVPFMRSFSLSINGLLDVALAKELTPAAYLVSVLFTFLVGAVLGALLLVGGLVFGFGRLVAPALGLPMLFQCGGPAPTEKPVGKRRGLGFEVLPGGMLGYHPSAVFRVKVRWAAAAIAADQSNANE